jgi:hypothetical protein
MSQNDTTLAMSGPRWGLLALLAIQHGQWGQASATAPKPLSRAVMHAAGFRVAPRGDNAAARQLGGFPGVLPGAAPGLPEAVISVGEGEGDREAGTGTDTACPRLTVLASTTEWSQCSLCGLDCANWLDLILHDIAVHGGEWL